MKRITAVYFIFCMGIFVASFSEGVALEANFEFVTIQPGTFKMGSDPNQEPEHQYNETQHEVTITRAFQLQTTEVTQGLWKQIMGNNPSESKAENLPVSDVSWFEVQEFVSALNTRFGLDCGDTKTVAGFNQARNTPGCYRLPTEAEWEYAARGGTVTKYSFGDKVSDLPKFARFKSNSSQAVGILLPNSFRLYDMHGNVYEWVQDIYQEDLGIGSQTDPLIESGSDRVFRGGSWGNFARGVRSAFRVSDAPNFRFVFLGFRLVRTL